MISWRRICDRGEEAYLVGVLADGEGDLVVGDEVLHHLVPLLEEGGVVAGEHIRDWNE